MTLLERDHYLDRVPGDYVNLTHGYPEGLNPPWLRGYQLHPGRTWITGPDQARYTGELRANPRPDWPDLPPATFTEVICGWFEVFFQVPVAALAPTCTLAFTIAAAALTGQRGDEVIVIDRSYDSWPVLLELLGASVVYARRTASGLPDLGSVAAACSGRTRAIVIVSPDNPLGVICPRDTLEQLITLCRERDITLLADHCLARLDPYRQGIPLLPHLARGRAGVSWIALGDTGKVLGLGGSKVAALACSPGWRDRLAAASSPFFFQLAQYDLAVIAAVLSDGRFSTRGISDQIGARHRYLRQEVARPLAVPPVDAGCFGLVDAAGLDLDDVSFAALLKDRYRVLTVPVSWFPAGQATPETRVRVALARPWPVIRRLAEALNEVAAAARTPGPAP